MPTFQIFREVLLDRAAALRAKLSSMKVLSPLLNPLTEQQSFDVCNLQQSSQQAEDALSQGMEKLQHTLAETLVSKSLINLGTADYMGQLATAVEKLEALVSFVNQWFEGLAGLLGKHWRNIGIAFNCTFVLFGSVIQFIACARYSRGSKNRSKHATYKDLTQERSEWRNKIHVANPNIGGTSLW